MSALQPALNTATAVLNESFFAQRSQTGNFSPDVFVFAGNPAASTWPSYKTTGIPFNGNTGNVSFGSIDSTGTIFTFSKAGVYSLKGEMTISMQGGSNVTNGSLMGAKIVASVNTNSVITNFELGQIQATVGVNGTYAGAISFGKDLVNVTVGTTLTIMGARSRYNSSASDDIVGTGLNGNGSIASWMEIVQLR